MKQFAPTGDGTYIRRRFEDGRTEPVSFPEQ
jgi:hypothetical protein